VKEHFLENSSMLSIENSLSEIKPSGMNEVENLRFLLSLNETVAGLNLSSGIAGKAIEKISRYFEGDYVSLLLNHEDPNLTTAYTSGNPVAFDSRSEEANGVPQTGLWETIPLPGNGQTPVFRKGNVDHSSAWIKLENIRSEVNFPIQHEGSQFGLLSLCRSNTAFQENELDTIRQATDIISQNLFLLERFKQLEQFAYQDGLTGALNRRAFDNHMDREFKRSYRYNTPLGMILLDVDHFKKLNDRWGHQVGDDVLRFIAGTIQDSIREIDFLFRYGGEEFAILLPETGKEEALLTADRIRKLIQDKPISGLWRNASVTASLGVSCMPTPEVNSSYDLVKLADSALYHSKNLGRNRVIGFPNPIV